MALTRKQTKYAYRHFTAAAGTDRLLDFAEWKRALAMRNEFLARRLFALVDTDESGFIDRDEFLHFVAIYFCGALPERLTFLFNAYDIDGDGFLDSAEITKVIEAALGEQSVKLDAAVVARMSGDLLRKTDLDKDKRVSCADFISALEAYPGIDEQLPAPSGCAFNELRFVGSRRVIRRIASAAMSLRASRFWHSYRVIFAWTLLYLAANLFLFVRAVEHYADLGASIAIQIARGAGACLDLNVALVLLPVCKGLTTALVATRMGRFLPLGDPMRVHRTLAKAIALFTVVHVAAHIYNYSTHNSIWHELSSTQVGITGVLATSLIAIMMWSHAYIRRHRYEWFMLTHLLYAVFIISLIFHSDRLLPWLAAPLLIFLCDAILRYVVKTRRARAELAPLADGVTKITFPKPKRFKYQPGDFLRLKVPAISSLQWHPFTIGAAPQAQAVSVYVRNNGDWSGALHNLSRKKTSRGATFPIRIDGAYATPSSGVRRAPVAVLIAAGIGITPFASVIESVIRQRSKNSDPQQIHFHWLNRSQHAYEWFSDLLKEAEAELGDRFKLHIHLTSLSYDLTNIGLQVAMDAYRTRRERDPITGLLAETTPGRPDWDAQFKSHAQSHPRQRVEVFFCGPPALGAEIRRCARKHGFLFHDEKF